MLARWLYTLLLHLALPAVLLRLLWRARRQPAYLEHWSERFGCPPRYGKGPWIWLHAVSVGETRGAQPLVEALLQRYPDHSLLLTGMTPTGRETAAQVFGNRVTYTYLPYDYPWAVRRFLAVYRPRLGLLMETELWPNLLTSCQAAKVPVMLVNARLSARSARGYARLRALFAPALQSLAGIAAQTEADAARLQDLGGQNIQVCGNLKFDVAPNPSAIALGQSWRHAIGPRPIWLAASTREGEEELILDALEQLPLPDLLLVLVPRHPQRFDAVAGLVQQRGLSLLRRSQGMPGPDIRVWLGDSMGEMAAYYTLGDLAVMGGSLLPFGGQNLIEAAACGCPVLVGPHTFNFAQAAADAVVSGAAQRLETAGELVPALQELLDDKEKRRTMQDAALHFATAHRGATARTLALIETLIAPAVH
ncbi:MAG: lipid IV(A) 3-deoxy-D-manno-octulosonic acid transferase [Betaproteobacteria bacterium]|nr:lipid IV(A) 3-deoxy-D-manno-octulosonic acid transferase [Betaproteobacteria bacterium]